MNGEEGIIEIRISPSQAEALVEKLINDMEFRERLAQDPNEELRQYGISVPPALIPERVELPSPDEIRQARDAMDAEYGEQKPYMPYMLFGLLPLGWCRRQRS
jgi:putative modified peptide